MTDPATGKSVLEFTPLEFETLTFHYPNAQLLYQNLLRWSLKRFVNDVKASLTELEFTPLEFEIILKRQLYTLE